MQELFNKALAFHQSGQFAEAESLYRQVLTGAPDHPILNARLGMLMMQTGRPEQGLAQLALAIEQAPRDIALLKQAIALAIQAGANQRAEAWLRRGLQACVGDSSLHEQLAGVLIANHQEAQALESIKTALRLDPQNANAYNLKGLALCRLGDTEKGYAAFQKAVRMNPGQLGAVKNLVQFGKGRKEPLLEQLIPQLEQRLNQPGLQPVVQLNLAFMLAAYYEQQKDVARHFTYLRRANDLARLQHRYSHHETEAYFEAWTAAFTPARIQAIRALAEADDGALFILGLPRSGTTLIEQILSSHSGVGAEGEILDLQQCVDASGGLLEADLSDDEFARRAVASVRAYLDRVRSRQTARHFTDKLPYNFIVVGLIATALPNAKIIHCTRDPLETCFSMYRQHFAGAQPHTNDLRELGQYFRAYKKLMDQWQVLFGEQIFEANYERMVQDAEAEITRLLEFCGLEPEAACYAFHRNTRAVRTASVTQVRRPIYTDSVSASDPYRAYLQPLIDELNLSPR
jgi:Flp pilus assembly protein TadD